MTFSLQDADEGENGQTPLQFRRRVMIRMPGAAPDSGRQARTFRGGGKIETEPRAGDIQTKHM
ncbi:hypothetical protein [Mesorhizobium sp. Mes31]|uniref:hypothetical protein n=1 Tax=Mesorhizobium sp. Mes31 TaxID=2926017 RepID=UPI00211783D9|nr:hypothetical protein [Mesorhizobium sp. Mes31]